MSYNLHITRRRFWADDGNEITSTEWLAYVRDDSELRLSTERGPCFAVWTGTSDADEPWLDWSDGRIFTENPDAALVDKMVAMAGHFGASVQGDDGEIYENGSTPPRQQTRSRMERVKEALARALPARRAKIEHEPALFEVGDQVRDTWGNEHTVIGVDPKAVHGMGLIRTVRHDGTEHLHSMIAHGLSPIDDQKGDDNNPC